MEDPMSRLPHDLTAEILSRIPYKSLCICKCVCPAWRDIIADPVYRKNFAQSLAGFFYNYRVVDEDSAKPCYPSGVNYADLSAFSLSSVPRTSPRLSVPPASWCSLMDSCDGLFLARICKWLRFLYIVSNPSTGEYTVLPHSGYYGCRYRFYLGFDRGVSTEEFHVFEFGFKWTNEGHDPCQGALRGLKIYSSKTGVWVESQCDVGPSLWHRDVGVFHKGYLHFITSKSRLAIVDAEGLKWRTIRVPDSDLFDPGVYGFIGKSAGQLFYINCTNPYSLDPISAISVYVLSAEVYHSDRSQLDDEFMHWKLLHERKIRLGSNPKVIGVHPHDNMVFITDSNNQLLAYDLDHHETTTVHHIEHNYQGFRKYFPYVPLLPPLPLDGGMQLATPHHYGGGGDVPHPDLGGRLAAEVPLHWLQSIYQQVCHAAPLWLRRLLLQLLLWFRQRRIH